MNKSSRIYDFNLTAGGSYQLPVEGDYVRVMSSTGPVELVTDEYRLGPLSAGQGQQGAPYKRLTINDRSGQANSGTILVASSGFIDQRISGDVTVIDIGRNRSLAGSAFVGFVGSFALVANYSYAQLVNPPGSGKNLFIEQIGSQTGTAFGMQIGTQFGNVGTNLGAAKAKKLGSPASVGMMYSGTFPSRLDGFYGVYNGNLWTPKAPVIIPPGASCYVVGNTPNQDVSGAFEFFEELI